MITFLQLLILSLATFRVTRLLIEDFILEPLRDRTIHKLDPRNKFRELFECPWCLGFWLSIGAVVLFLLFPVVTIWLALPFAISTAVGLIAEKS